MQLQEQLSVVGEPVRRGVDEPPVRSESVSGGEDGLEGLHQQVWMLGRSRLRHVGQVRDDQVDRRRHLVEQIALVDEDTVFESVTTDVCAGELDGGAAGVRRPYLDVGALVRDRDCDRATARPDICDARAAPDQARAGFRDQLLARRARVITLPGALSKLRPLNVT